MRLLGASGDAGVERRLELLVPLASTLAAAGQLAEGRAALTEAFELVPAEAVAIRGRIAGAISRIDHMLGRHGTARALLDDALSQSEDAPSAATVTLRLELAMDFWFAPDWGLMRSHAAEALAEARQLDDRPLRAAAAATLALAEYYLAATGDARAHLAEAAGIVDELPDPELAERLETLMLLGHAESGLEQFPASAVHLQRGIEIARGTGQGAWFVMLTCLLVVAELGKGRTDRALAAADASVDAALAGHPQPLIRALSTRCWANSSRGDLQVRSATGRKQPSWRWGGPRRSTAGLLTRTWARSGSMPATRRAAATRSSTTPAGRSSS